MSKKMDKISTALIESLEIGQYLRGEEKPIKRVQVWKQGRDWGQNTKTGWNERIFLTQYMLFELIFMLDKSMDESYFSIYIRIIFNV